MHERMSHKYKDIASDFKGSQHKLLALQVKHTLAVVVFDMLANACLGHNIYIFLIFFESKN